MTFSPPPITLGLLVMLAASAWFAANRTGVPSETAQISETRSSFIQVSAEERLTGRVVGPMADYSSILERPIFSETRRPRTLETDPDAPQKAADPAGERQVVTAEQITEPPADPDLQLKGVHLGSSGSYALLAGHDGSGVWYIEGATMNGWRLVEITAEAVILMNAGTKHKIELYSID